MALRQRLRSRDDVTVAVIAVSCAIITACDHESAAAVCLTAALAMGLRLLSTLSASRSVADANSSANSSRSESAAVALREEAG